MAALLPRWQGSFPAIEPQFTALAAAALDSLPNAEAAIDSELAQMYALWEPDAASAAGPDADLAALAFTAGEFAAATLAPIATELNNSLTGGEAALTALETDLGLQVEAPPAPTPPSPPEAGGGGGGGILPPSEGAGGYLNWWDEWCRNNPNYAGCGPPETI